MRSALAAIVAAAGLGWVAFAADAGEAAPPARWTTVAVGEFTTWAVDKTSVFAIESGGVRRRAAPVLRTQGDEAVEYIAIVEESQCGSQTGRITVKTAAGAHVQTGLYVVAARNSASAIAAALCEGVRR